jgi:hypothetical protein
MSKEVSDITVTSAIEDVSDMLLAIAGVCFTCPKPLPKQFRTH